MADGQMEAFFLIKSLKLLPPDVIFYSQNAPNLISAAALSHITLGAY